MIQNDFIKTHGEYTNNVPVQITSLDKQGSRLQKLIKIQNKSLNKLFQARKDGLKSVESVFQKENNMGQTEDLREILKPSTSNTGTSLSSTQRKIFKRNQLSDSKYEPSGGVFFDMTVPARQSFR